MGQYRSVIRESWGVVTVWRGTGVVMCGVYWRCLKGAVDMLISCNVPLKVSKLLGDKCIRWKSVPLCYCSGEMDICVYLCGWLELVWSCPGLRYWLGPMSRRLFVILYIVESLATALLCSRVGQEAGG